MAATRAAAAAAAVARGAGRSRSWWMRARSCRLCGLSPPSSACARGGGLAVVYPCPLCLSIHLWNTLLLLLPRQWMISRREISRWRPKFHDVHRGACPRFVRVTRAIPSLAGRRSLFPAGPFAYNVSAHIRQKKFEFCLALPSPTPSSTPCIVTLIRSRASLSCFPARPQLCDRRRAHLAILPFLAQLQPLEIPRGAGGASAV